jgi:putative acetyltransferase
MTLAPGGEECMGHITIQPDDPASPENARLLHQLDEYLTALYPPESNHILTVEELRQPNVTFLTARLEVTIIGCGAYVNHDGAYAEIKRMFVLPRFRGLRVGQRILGELESLARASGLRVARLETGVAQPEALHLYEKAGYRKCGTFGSYPEDPLCVFMEKQLG